MAGDKSERDALAALQAHFDSSFEAAPVKPIEKLSRAKPIKIDERQKKERKRMTPPLSKEPFAVEANKGPQTIVFGEQAGESSSSQAHSSAGGWRKFMSAKVATRKDKTDEETNAKQFVKAEQGEEERELMTNDRALSELLSSTLFAPEEEAKKRRANGKPNLSSNATLSRILELSQPSLTDKPRSVGRGLGGSMMKADELGKMPASMRHGMRRAALERQANALEKTKELGLYHQSIKGMLGKGAEGTDLVQGTRERDRRARTRQRGLSMGVGKFSNGALRLSKDEVHRINAKPDGGKKRKR